MQQLVEKWRILQINKLNFIAQVVWLNNTHTVQWEDTRESTFDYSFAASLPAFLLDPLPAYIGSV